MNHDLQAEIDSVMDRIRSRVQEIAPLAMKQLHRVADNGDGDQQDRLRDRLVDLSRDDEQLTELCCHLAVLSRIAEANAPDGETVH